MRWIVSTGLVLLAAMMVFRLIFLFRYSPSGASVPGNALLLGLRFDIKFVCILITGMLVLCAIPFLHPFKNCSARIIWTVFFAIFLPAMLFFYAADYYYYDYVKLRLNAGVLEYLQDTKVSSGMVWETYPIVRIMLGIAVLSIIGAIVFNKTLLRYQTTHVVNKRSGIGYYIIFLLLFGLGIFGRLHSPNLRWSDAFVFNNTFKATVALNPFQSFFGTLDYKIVKPKNEAREYYNIIAPLIGVQHPDSVNLNYERNYTYINQPVNKPNIVVVVCESFSMYKSSMSGNPLNTTPFFNSLCKNGVFFNRCFTPSYPTARGMWATVTALPDVLADNITASRTNDVLDQHVIMNDFKGYEKFYFLGGDPNYANIKSILKNNIDSLHIYSQENLKAKSVDIWGVDDKNLFLESSRILATQQKPFFAIIQTADNHRPYTIPKQDLASFKKVKYAKDTLTKYGFYSNEELNAFRYTDFCFQKFFESASKEKFFDNTIFVFAGDHGLPGNANAVYPQAWTEKNLSYNHVPLLFYAPKLLQPKLITQACSQADIMPSLAYLAAMPHKNTALGKNLFDNNFLAKDYAFIIDHELRTIGMVNSKYYYTKNLKSGKTDIVSVTNNNPLLPTPQTDSIKNEMGILTEAYYQTARYLLYHNKKQN